MSYFFFFFQAEDGIRDYKVTGVQTCALPIFFTKGEPAEQAAKVERSGLQGFFEFIEIVPEKDPETYGGLVHKHKIVKTHGWMIGNSPRSDINPAMKIGLNAVYIPHQHTWTLEHEPVVAGARKLVILPAFRELRGHF